MTTSRLSECIDKITGCKNESEERKRDAGFHCSGGRDHSERQGQQQCMYKALGFDYLFSVSHTGRGLIISKFGTADPRRAMIFVQTNCIQQQKRLRFQAPFRQPTKCGFSEKWSVFKSPKIVRVHKNAGLSNKVQIQPFIKIVWSQRNGFSPGHLGPLPE